MKKILFLITVLTIYTSCSREEDTNYIYVLDNKTNVKVGIQSYTNGELIKDTFVSAQSFIVYSYFSTRGKHGEPQLTFPQFGVDSILITYADQYSVLHLKNDTFYTGTRKTLDSNSNRSFTQINSYDINVTKETKIRIDYEIRYTFTEADYEFAKQ